MKKKYISPQVRSFTVLPAQIIATSVAVGAKDDALDAVEKQSNLFWSKTFGGTITEDEEDDYTNVWGE